MHSLEDGLVEALGLHSELQDGKDGFLAHLRGNLSLVIVLKVVHGIVLQIDTAAAGAAALFLVQHTGDIVDQLVLAVLFYSLSDTKLALGDEADLLSGGVEHAPNFKH